jgi:predicted RNase H-like HicB family nuclease
VSVSFPIELDREDDGRWIAEIHELPGVICYAATREEAIARVQALALRVLAERLENAETPGELLAVSYRAA